MLQSFLNAWRLPDLRKKLLFTAMIIAIYRLGCYIPVPGVDTKAVSDAFSSSAGGVFDFYNLFTGGGLQRVAIFALGIMPYITASIIMQLLTMVIPRLEALMKEGESGQKKVNQYTRYFTVILALIESIGFVFLFDKQYNAFSGVGGLTPLRFFLVVLTLTVGTALVMWLGELITQRGIGNGISLMIFTSIVSRLPERSAASCSGSTPATGSLWASSPCSWWLSSSTSRRGSAASRCSTPSGWWAARSTEARARTCRSASTWRASSR